MSVLERAASGRQPVLQANVRVQSELVLFLSVLVFCVLMSAWALMGGAL